MIKMKNLKMILVAFMVITFANVKAQSYSSLIGQWKTIYEIEGEKIHVNYQFSYDNEKLLCRTLSLKDDKGNGEAYEVVVMSDIHFEKGKGEAKYSLKYEGETYEITATLQLINTNTLEVSYSYYGYTDTEVWKRIE